MSRLEGLIATVLIIAGLVLGANSGYYMDDGGIGGAIAGFFVGGIVGGILSGIVSAVNEEPIYLILCVGALIVYSLVQLLWGVHF